MSIINNPYKGDYDHTPELDKNGRFVDRFYYKGDLYILPFDEEEKKKTYLPCLLCGLLMIVVIVGQGLINQTSSRTIWVVLPYLAQFLPSLFFFVGVYEYVTATPRMTKRQYDKGILRMKGCAISVIFLAFISAICDIVYMVITKSGYDTTKEVIYLLLHVLTIMAALLFGKYYNKKFANIEISKNN